MALIAIRCACGHGYEAITGSTISDPDAERCPKCGSSELERLIPSRVGIARGIDVGAIPADDMAMHLENKAYMEANSEKLLSGEFGHVVPSSCPPELRPVCPEHLRKRYY